MYIVFIKDTIGNLLYEIPFVSCSFNEELNRGKDATFSIDYRALLQFLVTYGTDPLTVLAGGFREIYIEKDGAKVYYGVISDYQLNKDINGGLTITLGSVGFFSLFGKRRTGLSKIYTNQEASDIAWGLIDDSQNDVSTYGDLGITRGLHPDSVKRDRTFRFANIKEEIEKMSNLNLLNGFDFEIDNLKQFQIYYPQKGTLRSDIILDDRNIVSWQYHRPLVTSLTNRVYVLGEGTNDDVLYVTKESSADYMVPYKLLEDVLTERDIITVETLNDKGDRFLSNNQSPIVSLFLVTDDKDLDILTYDVGDSVPVVISELSMNKLAFRIVKRTVIIDQSSGAEVDLTMELK